MTKKIKNNLLKKAAITIFCFVLGFNAFGEESSKKGVDFLLGGGLSIFGPEISFNIQGNRWEAEAGLAGDLFRVGKEFGNFETIGITPKVNFGYLFKPLPKSGIQFSVGANAGTYIDFLEPAIWAVGGYGKISKLFGEHFNLALETYLPLYISGWSKYQSTSPVIIFLDDAVFGLCFTTLYLRYKF